ncbi:hypothetical protein K438DRAFT_1573267, partial [Mycena galopus ATCC 62051]
EAATRVGEKPISLDEFYYAPHHGRSMNPAMQRANLERLKDASSNPAAFWKVPRDMVNPRKKLAAVSLPDLASRFGKIMNAPEPPPASFNMRLKHATEKCAQAIPTPSVDTSEDKTSNKLVTVKNR